MDNKLTKVLLREKVNSITEILIRPKVSNDIGNDVTEVKLSFTVPAVVYIIFLLKIAI